MDLFDPVLTPLLILFGAVIVARLVSESALGRLSSEQKVIVLDAFSFQRRFSLIFLVTILAVFHRSPGTLAALIAVYVIGVALWSFRKLSKLDLPQFYTRSFLAAQGVQLGGLAAYATSLWLQ